MVRKIVIAGLLLLMTCRAAAAEIQKVQLSQATAQLPVVKAYADLVDADENPVQDLEAVRVTASLAGRALKFTALAPFDKTGEGVAYTFVIDCSESIEPARFEEIRAALREWIQALDAKDRVAVLGFAEKVHVLADFADDREKTLAAAQALSRSGKKSLIYRALSDAVENSLRNDAGMPGRRAIVVITDGKDEGSGLKSDDVLEQAKADHVPIYAVGFSTLPTDQRRRFLDELHRIAEKSGGIYVEARAQELKQAFAGMKSAIRRVTVASFSCSDCTPEPKKQRLELRFDAGKRSFSDTVELTVAPPQPPSPEPAAKPLSWWRRPRWMVAMASAVLGVLALGIIFWIRGQRPKSEPVEPPPSTPTVPFLLGKSNHPDISIAKPAAPAESAIRLQFTVVRGRRRGITSEVRMGLPAGRDSEHSMGRLLIGRRAACHMTVTDDETVSSEHCEILCINDKLVIRDLRSSNGTFVNGIPIAGDRPLEPGDRIGIGQTEYRVGVISESL